MHSAWRRPPKRAPFRTLERALTRRRLRELDRWLALEVAALALLLAAVLFWQVRVPLDGWAHRARAPRDTLAVALALFAHRRRAVRRARGRPPAPLAGWTAPDGPPWLALPLSGVPLTRHLEWQRARALPFFLLAQFAIWLALFGLVPLWALIALGAGACLLTERSGRAGAAIAMRTALGGAFADDVATLARVLTRIHTTSARGAARPPRRRAALARPCRRS